MSESIHPQFFPIGRQVDALWSLSLYPDAREAGGCFVPARAPIRSVGVKGQAEDPDRAVAEAARRARGKLRRHCAANVLNRLGTLTYRGAGCHDPERLRYHVGEFFRTLRSLTGGQAFPYAWMPEWHPGGHGLHVHFAIGRFIKRQLIEQAWGHGFVHIKLIGDLPVGSGKLAEARLNASYLSKYVTKGFADADRQAGLHRYDLAQGFQPRAVWITGRSAEEVIAIASGRLGAEPALRWSSAEAEVWSGAPAIWAQWT